MSEPQTINPDQLGVVADAPVDAHVLIHSPAGPIKRLPHARLLSKLVATGTTKATRAELEADLAHAADTVALVHNDPTALLNGWYRKTGAAGAGAWSQFEVLSIKVAEAIQAAAAATSAAAELLAGSVNFYGTFAEAVADLPVGAYFTCFEPTATNPDGDTRTYRRVAGAPGYADQGDKAAPLTRWNGLSKAAASIYPVSDPYDLQAALNAAGAAGGGIVRLRRGMDCAVLLALTRPANVILDLNGGRLRPAAGMGTLVTSTGPGGGIVNGHIDGDGLCSNYVINGGGYSDLLIEQVELTGWKRGFYSVCTDADMTGVRVYGMDIHSPAAVLATEADRLIYPFWLGGGANYQRVVAPDIDTLRVWGAGGNYQDYNGTADQIALQNLQGGRLRRLESYDGGENGISVTRCSAGVWMDDIVVAGNNGIGLQVGSARVEMVVDDASDLVVGKTYIASPSGARGVLARKTGNRIFLSPIPGFDELFEPGIHLLFLPGDSLADITGEDVVDCTVSQVIFGDGFTIGTVTATDNSRDAPGVSAGIMLQYVRGRRTDFTGLLRCTDTRTPPQQSYPLLVVRSDNVGEPVRADFRGNINNASAWFSTPGVVLRNRKEWQVPDIALPAIAPGDSYTLNLTLPGALSSDWLALATSGGPAMDALTVLPPVCVTAGTVRVRFRNDSGAYFAGATGVLFRVEAQTKSDSLVNTSGASAGAGTTRKGPGGMRRMLSADFTVNNSAALTASGLAVPVEAGRRYAFQAQLWVSSGATPGFRVAAALSETGDGGYTSNRVAAGIAETALGTATTGTGSATRRLMFLDGFCVPTVTGELRILFAQNTADASDSKLLAPSRLEVFAA